MRAFAGAFVAAFLASGAAAQIPYGPTDAPAPGASAGAPARFRARLAFDPVTLLPGSYTLRVHPLDPEGLRLFDTWERAVRVTGEATFPVRIMPFRRFQGITAQQAVEPRRIGHRAQIQAPGLHLWGTEAEEVLRLPGADRDLGMGLSEAMVRFAARQEWALTVEDMLARRWRALFLDARQAARMAPAVAALLQEETGLDPRLSAFLELCQRYTLAD